MVFMLGFSLKSFIGLLLLFFSQNQLLGATLNINVTNIKESKEELIVYLCNNEDCHTELLKPENRIQNRKLPISNEQKVKVTSPGSQLVRFENLPPGKYSVFILHDLLEPEKDKPEFENQLGKLWPLEPFGVSGLEKATLPGSFDDVATELKEENSVKEINVKLLRANGMGDVLNSWFESKLGHDFENHINGLRNSSTCFL